MRVIPGVVPGGRVHRCRARARRRKPPPRRAPLSWHPSRLPRARPHRTRLHRARAFVYGVTVSRIRRRCRLLFRRALCRSIRDRHGAKPGFMTRARAPNGALDRVIICECGRRFSVARFFDKAPFGIFSRFVPSFYTAQARGPSRGVARLAARRAFRVFRDTGVP